MNLLGTWCCSLHGRGVPLLACQAEGEPKNKAVCVLVREFGDHVMEEQDGQVGYYDTTAWLCVCQCVCNSLIGGKEKIRQQRYGAGKYGESRN